MLTGNIAAMTTSSVATVPLVAHSWVYSYFWTAAAIVYLLLRQDVDGTPWHVIAAPERRPFEFDLAAAAEPPGDRASASAVPAQATPPPATPVSSGGLETVSSGGVAVDFTVQSGGHFTRDTVGVNGALEEHARIIPVALI